MKCGKCGEPLVYDTNRVLICPRCDKTYWDAETGKNRNKSGGKNV